MNPSRDGGRALSLPPARDPSDRSTGGQPIHANGASAPPPAPAFGAAPPPAPPPYPNNSAGPEYQSNSRMRPTVVPTGASAWEAFYQREILGFPAPVAFVLAAVLLSSVIAAIAMLVR